MLRQRLTARGRHDGGVIAGLVSPRPASRTRAWGIVGALSVTESVSWGILYYAFAVFLLPMQHELGYSAAQLTGAFSLALLVSAVAGLAVDRDRHRDDDGALRAGVHGAGQVVPRTRGTAARDDGDDARGGARQLHLPAGGPDAHRRLRLA